MPLFEARILILGPNYHLTSHMEEAEKPEKKRESQSSLRDRSGLIYLPVTCKRLVEQRRGSHMHMTFGCAGTLLPVSEVQSTS